MTERIIAEMTNASDCPNMARKTLSSETAESSSFSGMFTIPDAVTISLSLTDDGRVRPQERKSGVALCRTDEATA